MRLVSFCYFGCLVLLSACVSNKKFQYLQKNDVNKRQTTDTVLRNYGLDKFVYRIQTNDIVSVRYQSLTDKNFDFLSQQTVAPGNALVGGALLYGELVDERGEIPMPVVGKVKVGGLSVFQAQDTIQHLANLYLESPIVKVRLLNYRVTVLGEVNKEGSITINNNRASLPEVIGLAGGLNELADRANVKIIRQEGSEAKVQYVNLLKEDLLTSPFYYVHQNDVIVVPPLRQRPFRVYFGQNLSIILSSVSVLLLIITLNRK